MTTALRDVHATTRWTHGDLTILQQLSAGLKALGECLYTDPIRSRAHAHHVMQLHHGHQCARYGMAARYAMDLPNAVSSEEFSNAC